MGNVLKCAHINIFVSANWEKTVNTYVFVMFEFKDNRDGQVACGLSGNFSGHYRCKDTFFDHCEAVNTKLLHSLLPVEEFILFVVDEENGICSAVLRYRLWKGGDDYKPI